MPDENVFFNFYRHRIFILPSFLFGRRPSAQHVSCLDDRLALSSGLWLLGLQEVSPEFVKGSTSLVTSSIRGFF